jgi:hypothetical protein
MVPSMENVFAKDLADRTGIRTVPICGYSLWSLANCLEGLLEKTLGGVHISLLAEHGINQIAILINGTIQVAPLSLDSHRGLINMPGGPSLTTSFCAQLVCDQGNKGFCQNSGNIPGGTARLLLE